MSEREGRDDDKMTESGSTREAVSGLSGDKIEITNHFILDKSKYFSDS